MKAAVLLLILLLLVGIYFLFSGSKSLAPTSLDVTLSISEKGNAYGVSLSGSVKGRGYVKGEAGINGKTDDINVSFEGETYLPPFVIDVKNRVKGYLDLNLDVEGTVIPFRFNFDVLLPDPASFVVPPSVYIRVGNVSYSEEPEANVYITFWNDNDAEITVKDIYLYVNGNPYPVSDVELPQNSFEAISKRVSLNYGENNITLSYTFKGKEYRKEINYHLREPEPVIDVNVSAFLEEQNLESVLLTVKISVKNRGVVDVNLPFRVNVYAGETPVVGEGSIVVESGDSSEKNITFDLYPEKEYKIEVNVGGLMNTVTVPAFSFQIVPPLVEVNVVDRNTTDTVYVALSSDYVYIKDFVSSVEYNNEVLESIGPETFLLEGEKVFELNVNDIPSGAEIRVEFDYGTLYGDIFTPMKVIYTYSTP